MKKRATTKRKQTMKAAAKAAKAAKISENARRRREAEENRPRYSIDNPPTSFTMTVQHLAELRNRGLHQTYREVNEGRWPTLPRPDNKGPFEILTIPTLAILRNEQPPPGPAQVGAVNNLPQPTLLRKGRSEDRTTP